MSDYIYVLTGLAWVFACLMLGLYIRGKGLSGKKHYRVGLKTIFVLYLVGICMLFVVTVFS